MQLVVENLRKTYENGVRALDGISRAGGTSWRDVIGPPMLHLLT